MSPSRPKIPQNPVVCLLLGAALLRGFLDCIRVQTDFWPYNWVHNSLYFPGILIAGLVIVARTRPILAASAALLVQLLMIAYFFMTMWAHAAVWVHPEGIVLVLLLAALGIALNGHIKGKVENFSVMWIVFTAAVIRCLTDFSNIAPPRWLDFGNMWDRLLDPQAVVIIIINLLIFVLAFAARRYPCTALTLTFLWQVPPIVILLFNITISFELWPILLYIPLTPAFWIFVWLAIALAQALKRRRCMLRPAGTPLKVSAP